VNCRECDHDHDGEIMKPCRMCLDVGFECWWNSERHKLTPAEVRHWRRALAGK